MLHTVVRVVIFSAVAVAVVLAEKDANSVDESCKDGRYWNGAVAACRSCHSSCKTCFDKNSKSCDSCHETASKKGDKYGHILSVDYCTKDCGRGRHVSPNPRGGIKCRDCHVQCGPSGCAGHGPNDCISCRNFMSPSGECVASCAKGFGSDDTGLCRPHGQVPILNWLKKIGASEQAVAVFAAKGISFREVEKMNDQALLDVGVVLSKDRALIIDKITSKMFKLRTAYARYVREFEDEYMAQVPKLGTTDMNHVPGVDDEREEQTEEEEVLEEEEAEPAPKPVCPFESEDAFLAAFNSNPAVIEFKSVTCMTYTTNFLTCKDKQKDCAAAKQIFLKQIAKIYHPDRFSKVHAGCNNELVMLPFMTLTNEFTICKKEQKEARRKGRISEEL